MTESQRLEIIRQMASNNNATQLSPVLKSFVDDLRADILAEELIVEHGLLGTTERDVEDEVSHLQVKMIVRTKKMTSTMTKIFTTWNRLVQPCEQSLNKIELYFSTQNC